MFDESSTSKKTEFSGIPFFVVPSTYQELIQRFHNDSVENVWRLVITKKRFSLTGRNKHNALSDKERAQIDTFFQEPEVQSAFLEFVHKQLIQGNPILAADFLLEVLETVNIPIPVISDQQTAKAVLNDLLGSFKELSDKSANTVFEEDEKEYLEVKDLLRLFPLEKDFYRTWYMDNKAQVDKLLVRMLEATPLKTLLSIADQVGIDRSEVVLAAGKFVEKLKGSEIHTFGEGKLKTGNKALLQRVIEIQEQFPQLQGLIDAFLIRAGVSALNPYKNSLKSIEGLFDQFPRTKELASAIDNRFVSTVQTQGNFDDDLIFVIDDIAGEKYYGHFPETWKFLRERIKFRMPFDEDLADAVYENYNKYQHFDWAQELVVASLGHFSVAQKFLKDFNAGKWNEHQWAVILQPEVKNFVDAKKKQFVSQQKSIVTNYTSDSAADLALRFSREDQNAADQIFNVMNGGQLEADSPFEAYSSQLQTLNSKLDLVFQEYVRALFQEFTAAPFQNSTSIELKNDAPVFLGNDPLVKMPPLIDVSKRIIARYIAHQYRLNLENLEVWEQLIKEGNEIQTLFEDGLAKITQVYQTDIPLYDKLYEEFDKYREDGRNPLEVYLGRDGIYAYVGRRSIDVARRRALGWQERVRLRMEGRLVSIHPQYLVYPRFFRDNLDSLDKYAYLSERRIFLESDPLFFDTGYRGTIPEQIMEIMGFPESEIESRIRLLSADLPHRRIKGVSENARTEIVEDIEHNAKLEETATGMNRDPKTKKITHVALPTSLREQCLYLFVEQALVRHYWYKEMKHKLETNSEQVAVQA